MRSRRAVTILQSTVVLAFITTTSARSQTQNMAQESSSSSQLTAALFAPTVEPDAPSAIVTTSKPVAPRTSKWKPETSISLGAFGFLTPAETGSNSFGTGYQKLGNAPGVLGTFRQTFRPWLGYSVNMGYSRTAETSAGANYFPLPPNYNSGIGYTSYLRIPSNAYELSLSHIAHTNLTHHVTLFTEVGAGMLAFLPTNGGADVTSYPFPIRKPPVNFRPLGVFGGGLEYHLTSQLGLRGEFRGQFYKMPDFGGTMGKDLTFTSQPTVSLTYTFGAKKTYRR